MSDVNETNKEVVSQEVANDSKKPSLTNVKLNGLFARKIGMSSVFIESGILIPVTVLEASPLVVTQLKTKEKDGYAAVQISDLGKRAANASKAIVGHASKASSKKDQTIAVSREIRQELPADIQIGQTVSLDSFAKGDLVKVTAKSKGHGFAGSVKRWNFQGGPAAHGSKFHRQPGSSGNRTWPARVMPGKRFPGHYGDETTTLINVEVVQVIPEDGLILVKGPVPGGRNTLVKLMRQ